MTRLTRDITVCRNVRDLRLIIPLSWRMFARPEYHNIDTSMSCACVEKSKIVALNPVVGHRIVEDGWIGLSSQLRPW